MKKKYSVGCRICLNFFVGIILILMFAFLIGCDKQKSISKEENGLRIQEETFGKTEEGDLIKSYTLTDGKGIKVKLINYGAILVSLKIPDREGNLDDITLGYETLEGYIQDKSYIGATIGRYANRISKGRFTLDGVQYTLTVNDHGNQLHGGLKGFHKVIWKPEKIESADSVGIKFHYLSKDGEEGYPGDLTTNVTYILTGKSELKIYFEAISDKNTHVNLTHHSYFNLAGSAKRDILEHELTIVADQYTPVDESLIPTGEIKPVKDTDMDFTNPIAIGARIQNVVGGYDHNYVLNKEEGALSLAARVYEPESGRVMEIYTTEPGIQFYSGNFLDGSITGKGGQTYYKYYGFCLEPQHFPDSPNKPNFPSTILKSGEKYTHLTIFKFSTQ